MNHRLMRKMAVIVAMGVSLQSFHVNAEFSMDSALDIAKDLGGKSKGILEDVTKSPAKCAAFGAVVTAASKKDWKTVLKVTIGLAVICAAVKTIQNKSEAEVEKEYEKQNGELPAKPEVVSHVVNAIQNNRTVKKVDKNGVFGVRTYLEIIDGTETRINKVEEQVTLQLPNGKKKKFPKKVVNSDGSGGYTNTLEPDMEPGALKNLDSGEYTLISEIFINGKRISKKKNNSFTLAQAHGGLILAFK